ncbi:hypothetical protein OPIT5_23080 [Opitutaceae bacterium TAV5]|nr:hypothetical protein OPIT5_23080 [Opitutaceae bacterium TAV5]
MFVRDAKAAARIGVRVERRQAVWEWLQRQGSETWDWTGMDKGISNRAEQGIGTILTIRPEIRPRWTKWKSIEELADPKHLPDFSAFVRAVVSRYKDRILAVEIMNEPDLEVSRHAAGVLHTTEIYARILKAGYEASKSVAPDLPVIGLDVSGVDFPRLQFSKDVLSRASGYMDIFGGHPYNHSRYVGGDALPESPPKMDAAGRMRAMAALMRQHGLPPRIWSTEFGWALHLDEPLFSPSARLFAAFTAQAILLSRSVPEVEKLFWFAATFPGRERSSSYGMFRKADERTTYDRPDGNWFPSPSAAAYATCARLLDDVVFVRQFTIGPFCHVLRFANETENKAVLALWMEDTTSVGGGAKLRLPASASTLQSGQIIDALGREIPLSPTLDLEPLPVFVVVPAVDADRLEQSLRTATVEARERIVVQNAHVSRLDQISLDIINNDLRPVSAKVFQTTHAQSARSRLLPPGINALKIPATGIVLENPRHTSVTVLDERTSTTVTTEIRYHLRSLPRIDPQTSPLEQSLLRIATPIVLTQRDHVLPADPGVDWKGADDLSLTAWAGWTSEGIALAVHVKDDIHIGPPSGVTSLWSFDSLQVAFDLGNRAGHGYDDHCREFSLALDDAGRPVMVDSGGAKIPFLPNHLRIRRDGTLTCYDVLFPWSWLGDHPLSEGDAFRLNFIANDRDGATRKCWIGLTPGIGEAKQPAAFHQWILR